MQDKVGIGEFYGPYEVTGNGINSKVWQCRCTQCGTEVFRTSSSLLFSKIKSGTNCMNCKVAMTSAAKRAVREPRGHGGYPWKADPTGTLQQEWIMRGFVSKQSSG